MASSESAKDISFSLKTLAELYSRIHVTDTQEGSRENSG